MTEITTPENHGDPNSEENAVALPSTVNNNANANDEFNPTNSSGNTDINNEFNFQQRTALELFQLVFPNFNRRPEPEEAIKRANQFYKAHHWVGFAFTFLLAGAGLAIGIVIGNSDILWTGIYMLISVVGAECGLYYLRDKSDAELLVNRAFINESGWMRFATMLNILNYANYGGGIALFLFAAGSPWAPAFLAALIIVNVQTLLYYSIIGFGRMGLFAWVIENLRPYLTRRDSIPNQQKRFIQGSYKEYVPTLAGLYIMIIGLCMPPMLQAIMAITGATILMQGAARLVIRNIAPEQRLYKVAKWFASPAWIFAGLTAAVFANGYLPLVFAVPMLVFAAGGLIPSFRKAEHDRTAIEKLLKGYFGTTLPGLFTRHAESAFHLSVAILAAASFSLAFPELSLFSLIPAVVAISIGALLLAAYGKNRFYKNKPPEQAYIEAYRNFDEDPAYTDNEHYLKILDQEMFGQNLILQNGLFILPLTDQVGMTFDLLNGAEQLDEMKMNPFNRLQYQPEFPKTLPNRILQRQMQRYIAAVKSGKFMQVVDQKLAGYKNNNKNLSETAIENALKNDAFEIFLAAGVINPKEDFPQNNEGRYICSNAEKNDRQFVKGDLTIDPKTKTTREATVKDYHTFFTTNDVATEELRFANIPAMNQVKCYRAYLAKAPTPAERTDDTSNTLGLPKVFNPVLTSAAPMPSDSSSDTQPLLNQETTATH